ncbi:predicted protein [Phaeodactylum tricornutum CCAP 1055/1]|jgi:nicotinate phosphoribosyltransferase|uniref:Nicotinate phosphoribosyltransferase n=2 Tax=Phaeodactylum tricornutum TaxID=2850 RepID=B7G8I3_PHATC|nr:predicted protein [Phaeodactylum tricornutum CCAP 1055/1]EEC45049.1 predicted protein [Phaeodactylum tricornutum CCAP 1055/1]|eukprot:XP_002183349.1 predicted protein [Phaeodactylum tricornutum CCAP 1055/1]
MSGIDNEGSTPSPTNTLVTALLTDMYQISMTYAHWKNDRADDESVFELFFRRNPFGGEYTIFAGLDECLKFMAHFKFTQSDVDYLKTIPSMKGCDDAFFDWLLQVDTSKVKVYAMRDGSVAFPRMPLLMVQGPLGIAQLLETTLLTLVNYPSLIATNASRMVLAATERREVSESLPAQCRQTPVCVEFGLRRAQGPDGGFSASKYAAMGGFVATSNVQAGKLLGLNVAGTHAHAFVQTYTGLEEVKGRTVTDNTEQGTGENVEILPKVLEYRHKLATDNPNFGTTNDGELAAFIAYAVAFPHNFLCLVDTYETLTSGLLNFVVVTLVLDDLGYVPKGIRLDSGDLAYLSLECAKCFASFAEKRPYFHNLSIVASNDINEDVLHALNKQDHAITVYGIGTNLVTCQAQPALGCVYKLVEVEGRPRMKLSQEIEKVLIPGRKKPYRLVGRDGRPIMDLLTGYDESEPQTNVRILCRHAFIERKRAAVTPSRVEALHVLVFDHGKVVPDANRNLDQARVAAAEELQRLRPDVRRYFNPTPYKIAVTDSLFHFLHELWQSETPVPELS